MSIEIVYFRVAEYPNINIVANKITAIKWDRGRRIGKEFRRGSVRIKKGKPKFGYGKDYSCFKEAEVTICLQSEKLRIRCKSNKAAKEYCEKLAKQLSNILWY